MLLDETFAGNVEFGFTAVATGDQYDQLPRGHKMRYVNCTRMSGTASGFTQKSFPVGKMTATAWTSRNIVLPVGGISYAKTSNRGERIRTVIASNTGQIEP